MSAIDPSEGMLSYARTRPDAKLAEFRVGDAQALPYPDRSIDAATMALAISFIPDPIKAVKEMMRVVGPSGWVAAYMWDLPGGGIPSRRVVSGRACQIFKGPGSSGLIVFKDDGAIKTAVKTPLPQPTSSHRRPLGTAGQSRNASPTRRLQRPMRLS